MNVTMTTDEFHDVIMLYLVNLAKETKSTLDDPDSIIFTEEFDDFLRHIQSRPLGKLKTSYSREDARTRLLYRRLNDNMKDAEDVRLIL